MFHTRIYYHLKPFLPYSLRLALRRWWAKGIRAESHDVWPIKENAGRTPEGWPGWPGGKKFALVLTHDVEGRSGLEKCRRLMELERQSGFRSSFNLVPEGDYRVPAELREALQQKGFEVGVHDLKHDGKLYRNRTDFNRAAARINGYLRDWEAVGFRSAFMLSNQNWLHELKMLYDASSFDTDPFEPQPHGKNTIFPFWVAGRNDEGYVELPYTLPQDSTLFLLLREPTPELWFRKLDWVAQHGGMALVNVHPDYLRFEGDPSSNRTYPADFYQQFLDYAERRYGGTFWHPLPKDIAAFAAGFRPAPVERIGLRVCMLTHSFYESDNRVTRYAEALAERGDVVDVLALRRGREIPERETIAGVNVHRIQRRYGKNEKGQLSHLIPLLRFLVRAFIWITRHHLRRSYDLLHIHNVPDFLVFAAWYPKLTGAQVILDIHDVVPEFYTSKFAGREKSFTLTVLKWMERISSRFADQIIIANHLWLEKYAARTGSTAKCTVFINNVDSHIFRPRARTRKDGKLVVLFPGGLQWHQGLDIAIRAFTRVAAVLPQAEFHIYGDGNMKPSLKTLAQELGLNGKVQFFDPLRVREIAEVMANADLGVVPKRADSFGNEAYSTKIMEFMALGVPVVVSSTKVDQYYFNDSVVRFFESGNADGLAEAIIDMGRRPELRQQFVERGLEYVSRHSWENHKIRYLNLVDNLVASWTAQRAESAPERMV